MRSCLLKGNVVGHRRDGILQCEKGAGRTALLAFVPDYGGISFSQFAGDIILGNATFGALGT